MPQMIFSVTKIYPKKAVYSMCAPANILYNKRFKLVSFCFNIVMNTEEGGSDSTKINIVILWPYVPYERWKWSEKIEFFYPWYSLWMNVIIKLVFILFLWMKGRTVQIAKWKVFKFLGRTYLLDDVIYPQKFRSFRSPWCNLRQNFWTNAIIWWDFAKFPFWQKSKTVYDDERKVFNC